MRWPKSWILSFITLITIRKAYCIYEIKDIPKNMSNFCVPFANITFTKVCRGIVSEEIKIKYKDKRVEPGATYHIYIAQREKTFLFIIFHESELSNNCDKFQYTSMKKFTCVDTVKTFITLKYNQCFCLNFKPDYVVEHIKLCEPTLEKTAQRYIQNVAILYTQQALNMAYAKYGSIESFILILQLFLLYNLIVP